MQAKIGKLDQYILDLVGGAIRIQGNWDASTNSPDISSTTIVGYAWIVSVSGSTDLGGITSWQVGDLAVKTSTGWAKIDNQDYVTEAEGDIRYAKLTGATFTGDVKLLDSDIVLISPVVTLSITDVSTNPTTTTHNATISATSPMFGSYSAYCGASGYVKVNPTSKLAIGTQNFTFQVRVKPVGVSTQRTFIGFGDNDNNYIAVSVTDGYSYTRIWKSGSLIASAEVNADVLGTGTWKHLAIIRGWGNDNNKVAVTVNGSAVMIATLPNGTDLAYSNPMIVYNASMTLGTASTRLAYYDEAIVDIGTALWTSTFTPPATESSVGAYTKFLSRMGDGTVVNTQKASVQVDSSDSYKIKISDAIGTKVTIEQTTGNVTLVGSVQSTDATLTNLTASQMLATDANKKLVSLAVATYPSLIEFSYVKGLTSALQTQLDARLKLDQTTPQTTVGTFSFPKIGLNGIGTILESIGDGYGSVQLNIPQGGYFQVNGEDNGGAFGVSYQGELKGFFGYDAGTGDFLIQNRGSSPYSNLTMKGDGSLAYDGSASFSEIGKVLELSYPSIATKQNFFNFSEAGGLQAFWQLNLGENGNVNESNDPSLGAVRFYMLNDGGTRFGIQMAPNGTDWVGLYQSFLSCLFDGSNNPVTTVGYADGIDDGSGARLQVNGTIHTTSKLNIDNGGSINIGDTVSGNYFNMEIAGGYAPALQFGIAGIRVGGMFYDPYANSGNGVLQYARTTETFPDNDFRGMFFTNGYGWSIGAYVGGGSAGADYNASILKGSQDNARVIIGIDATDDATNILQVYGLSKFTDKLNILSANEQFQSGYDESNYFKAVTGSTGITTFDAVGSEASFIFSDDIYTTDIYSTNSGTVNRTSNTITSVAKTGGRTLTPTRDANGLISSITNGTKTWTLTRTNGFITSWSVT